MGKFSLSRILRSYRQAYKGTPLIFVLTVVGAAATSAWLWNFNFNTNGLGILTNALSIFGALLFGLIIPVIDQAIRYNHELTTAKRAAADAHASVDDDARVTVCQKRFKASLEVFSVVFFTIVIALVAVLLSLVLGQTATESASDNMFKSSIPQRVLTIAIVGCSIWCFLQVFMVLRGLFSIFAEEAVSEIE